ncbi:thermonuclease family protein [Hydrogenimonas thermophila]|uniref:Nuclease homologue n=1 Tax=Hydrogenimonas thermophila TaxID=223786 RepID=A0A1I5RTE6_9BACT|nr:thermonuclease family protein [Hydrogenimonas thermophila]SFP61660.1 nuclease homologue [Hydrogenimonas thermophila]
MKITKILLLFLLSPSLFAGSINNKNFGNVRVTEVTSIYDGDTFRVNIAEYPSIIGERIPIRINGIDTPELRGKCKQEKILARKAKQVTVNILRNAKVIELRNMHRGKYFRIVADVYVDGKSVAKELVKRDLAVIYHGHKKSNWCK